MTKEELRFGARVKITGGAYAGQEGTLESNEAVSADVWKVRLDSNVNVVEISPQFIAPLETAGAI